tara:strand:+ start:57 stop:224 length:168 start_codon:yes stop_codon:yes gene_type:complete
LGKTNKKGGELRIENEYKKITPALAGAFPEVVFVCLVHLPFLAFKWKGILRVSPM